MKMDQKRLNEIEERYHAASDGPWRAEGPTTSVYDSVAGSAPSGLKVAYDVLADGDAVFIAHARTDIPDMHAEILRLNSIITSITRQNSIMRSALFDISALCDTTWIHRPYWNANKKLADLTQKVSRLAYSEAYASLRMKDALT